MSDTSQDPIIDANRLAERIAKARQLRSEGAPEEEIAAIAPTKEEVREVLVSLRASRQPMSAPAKKGKPLSKQSLDELLGGDL